MTYTIDETISALKSGEITSVSLVKSSIETFEKDKDFLMFAHTSSYEHTSKQPLCPCESTGFIIAGYHKKSLRHAPGRIGIFEIKGTRKADRMLRYLGSGSMLLISAPHIGIMRDHHMRSDVANHACDLINHFFIWNQNFIAIA